MIDLKAIIVPDKKALKYLRKVSQGKNRNLLAMVILVQLQQLDGKLQWFPIRKIVITNNFDLIRKLIKDLARQYPVVILRRKILEKTKNKLLLDSSFKKEDLYR